MKRTCRAAADVGFCYRMPGLAEEVGDEGCTEISDLDPMRDPLWQRRAPLTVRARARERDHPAEGPPVERVDERFISIWGRRLVGGREGSFEVVVI